MDMLAWLRRLLQPEPPQRTKVPRHTRPTLARPVPPLPDGWTDDMTVSVAPPHTLDELVDVVLAAEARRDDAGRTISRLIETFGLSQADAELALDRTLGGVVRAATGHPDNCPRRETDPVAWISFQRCLREPGFITAIRPPYRPAAPPGP